MLIPIHKNIIYPHQNHLQRPRGLRQNTEFRFIFSDIVQNFGNFLILKTEFGELFGGRQAGKKKEGAVRLPPFLKEE